jgi:hypothetical protein
MRRAGTFAPPRGETRLFTDYPPSPKRKKAAPDIAEAAKTGHADIRRKGLTPAYFCQVRFL